MSAQNSQHKQGDCNESEARRSLLIFGGTFDPPHRAHVELPRFVADVIGCEQILYVPTSGNPLKENRPSAGEHRLAMLRLALADCERCAVSDVELQCGEKVGEVSYTVDTLEVLRELYEAEVEFRFLMGADSALSFGRWREPERILELATPAVMLRPPHDRKVFAASLAEIYAADQVERWLDWTVDVPLIDVSSSVIRRRIAEGLEVGDDLAASVHQYIVDHGLYRDTHGGNG